MLNHHLAGLLGLGSLAWAGHLVHVACLINKCLELGLDPLATPLPHAFVVSSARMNALFSGFSLMNVLALNWAVASGHRTSPLGDRSRISCCWPSLPDAVWHWIAHR